METPPRKTGDDAARMDLLAQRRRDQRQHRLRAGQRAGGCRLQRFHGYRRGRVLLRVREQPQRCRTRPPATAAPCPERLAVASPRRSFRGCGPPTSRCSGSTRSRAGSGTSPWPSSRPPGRRISRLHDGAEGARDQAGSDSGEASGVTSPPGACQISRSVRAARSAYRFRPATLGGCAVRSWFPMRIAR